MKFSVLDPNYCATIVRINAVHDLKGLDNLKGVNFFGFQALVSNENEVGHLGVVFTAETQLSESFASNNNLYRHSEKNKDQTKIGYLEDTARVRAISLKKHISSALFMPLSSLAYLGIDTNEFSEGDCFNVIDGIEICKKYVIKQNYSPSDKQKNNQLKKSRVLNKLIPEHISTSHWLKQESIIDDEANVTVTAKIHGCVHHSTIIETQNGFKTIKEIVDNRLNLKIKAYDINKQENIFVNIDEYYFKADTTDWYEIETEDGKILKITGNNPVWMPDLNCYRRAEDLLVGDILLVD